jgi:hypothetical protein
VKGESKAPTLHQDYAPEVRRAAARAIVAGRTMNGQVPPAWAVEEADLDYVPVPRKLPWWERFRRKGTAI